MNEHLTTIMSEYYQNIDIYKKLSHDVNDIINTLLEVNHIKISNMAIRIKSEEALRNKVMYKNKYTHLDEITDVLGVRIITLFENDVDLILDLLEKTFEICEIVLSMWLSNLQITDANWWNIKNSRISVLKFRFVPFSSTPGPKWSMDLDTNPSMNRR